MTQLGFDFLDYQHDPGGYAVKRQRELVPLIDAAYDRGNHKALDKLEAEYEGLARLRFYCRSCGADTLALGQYPYNVPDEA
jgi:hypothetical protein